MTRRAVLAGGLAAVLAAAATGAVAAPPVYRCGPDGREYAQQPCAKGRAVAVDDARSPAERDAATAVARRDARTAEALSADRRRLEARPASRAVALDAPRTSAPAPATRARRAPKRDGEGFKAVGPAPAKPRRTRARDDAAA